MRMFGYLTDGVTVRYGETVIDLPPDMEVEKIEGDGGGWAVSDTHRKWLIDKVGGHDVEYRYCWVPDNKVEPCKGCLSNAEAGWGPRHHASGFHPHCTCGTCF